MLFKFFKLVTFRLNNKQVNKKFTQFFRFSAFDFLGIKVRSLLNIITPSVLFLNRANKSFKYRELY
jgi:hypothetical protein